VPARRALARLPVRASWLGVSLLLSIAVSVLLREKCPWCVPIALLPLWSLRLAVDTKHRGYERYYETIRTLTLMLQRAHPYTHGHLERVAAYAEQVALRLGFTAGHARSIREASVLHDLGKIAVDEAVLDKPGKLTEEEMAHVRLHAELGAEILAPVRPFEALVPWVRHHHERPDGRGYPDRMLDVEIPLESKIIAVADAFDAMTVNDETGDRRSYRDPLSVKEALLELERCSGTQFDPRVVAVFREVVASEEGT
jgi:HD-GYP domain-containing protein (c-di-GMP phosphodiesterase class II)